jgi:hypothetical protein
MKEIKIKRKTEVLDERISTYDLTIKDSHHYILEDGTISHNTQDLFSKQVGGGGCLVPGSLVLMADSSYSPIENINEGDFVKTLSGDKEITKTWTFEKPTFKIEFEDDTELICSEDHRFFIGDATDDPLDDLNWVYAKYLVSGDLVSKYKSTNLTIKKVTELKSTKVHDLTVADVQHYITNNGAINHNTGPEYAASIILFLGKAKLKDGTEQTGIIVTAKPNKNRFAQPLPIKFHISFNKGMNAYIGLEEYISWDNCGIERGRFITEGQYEKLSTGDKGDCRQHIYTKEDKEVTVYFQPAATARKMAVAHLNDLVDLNELFTARVMTTAVLEKIEPLVKAKFSYGTDDLDLVNLSEILSEDHAEEND